MVNQRLSGPLCLDCGSTLLSCEATRDFERRPCCDRCEHVSPQPSTPEA